MIEVLLGVDVGTSACKVAAFTRDGKVVAQASSPYEVSYPLPGWAEQDPNDWWSGVCVATKDVLGTLGQGFTVAAVGVDGQSWSAVAVDKNGDALCPTPIWMDSRARDICDETLRAYGGDRLFRKSGNPLSPSYTFPKILWYKKHLPQVYQKAQKILQSNSYIVCKLTGELTQDLSQGYGLCCFDINKGIWDKALCQELGVNPDLLPDISPCHRIVGKVTREAAALCGLAEGTPVVAGGLDAACGTLGAGVIRPGQAQEQGGQAGGMSICMSQCKADERLILGNHVVPGLWLLQGGTVGGSGVLRWFESEFCASERAAAKSAGVSVYKRIDEEAAGVPAGSDGLVFLPYMAGERSPIWDSGAKGVYYGVGFSKTRAHFARSSMEGVAYSLRHNLDAAANAGVTAQVLHSVGGAANSRFWTQMKSDVTAKKILVPDADTATALGAAILAGVGSGVYSGFEQAVDETVHIKREHIPDMERHEQYKKGYTTYLELYESLKELMSKG